MRISETELANKVLTKMITLPKWVRTSYLMTVLDWPRDRGNFFRGVLDRLVHCGMLEKEGVGKFKWKLKRTVWDATNPFQQRETPNYASPLTQRVPPWVDNTPMETEEEEEETKPVDNSEIEKKLARYDDLIAVMEIKLKDTQEELVKVKDIARTSVRKIKVEIGDLPSITIEGRPHPKLERVLKLAHARLNILLIGPAGSGKSYLSEQIAQCLNLDYSFISCSAGMSEGQLLGRLIPTGRNGQFEYLIGEFVRTFEEGGVFMMDELDAADSNTLLILNSALASGKVAVPNRPSKPYAIRHKNFICIAAANTFGTGADRQYVGRNQLDESTLDRFRVGQVTMDYDKMLETYLCPDEELRERVWKYRANSIKGMVRRVISSRFLKDAYIAKNAGLTDSEIDEALFGGWREDEIQKARGVFAEV